jgi:hypothetical protein
VKRLLAHDPILSEKPQKVGVYCWLGSKVPRQRSLDVDEVDDQTAEMLVSLEKYARFQREEPLIAPCFSGLLNSPTGVAMFPSTALIPFLLDISMCVLSLPD